MYFSTVDTDAHRRAKTLLADLGKSTMRGVRKCPKCGTYNGTRGLSCKNKACDVVFKEAGEKRKQSIEVSKLDTGTSTRVFSVRVKDRGPDTRGFVQLPILEPDLTSVSVVYLSQVSALCFVDSCQRLFNTNLLKCHEKHMVLSEPTCPHILSAMRCCANASPLRIDYDVLQTLRMSNDMKEEIWRLANETPGPLVQRVSKNVMVVRTEVTTKDPLGFLHVSFVVNHGICTCSTTSQSSNKKSEKKSSQCLHYFACIASFASDSKTSAEFAQFIINESNSTPTLVTSQDGIDELDVEEPLVAILSSESVQEVEVFNKDLLLTDIVQEFEGLDSVDDVEELHDGSLNDQSLELMIKAVQNNKRSKQSHKTVKKHKVLLTKKTSPTRRKPFTRDMRADLGLSDGFVDETKTSTSYIDWLASVTERINQTMHYGFSGKPEPLVFHAPHAFFECLLERLRGFTANNKRKRLPDLVTTFTRYDAPPLGLFNNYTWHVTNIMHAKLIFDTPLVQLNVSRSFMIKSDGKFEEFLPDETHQVPKNVDLTPIKPAEFKTYLKIGKTSPDQTTPSVMTIDWTPNVLPISKIGELKITFEYGHTHTGSVECRKE